MERSQVRIGEVEWSRSGDKKKVWLHARTAVVSRLQQAQAIKNPPIAGEIFSVQKWGKKIRGSHLRYENSYLPRLTRWTAPWDKWVKNYGGSRSPASRNSGNLKIAVRGLGFDRAPTESSLMPYFYITGLPRLPSGSGSSLPDLEYGRMNICKNYTAMWTKPDKMWGVMYL